MANNTDAPSKWQRACLKRLRQAAELAGRQETGDSLDAAQRAKAARVSEFVAQAAAAGAGAALLSATQRDGAALAFSGARAEKKQERPVQGASGKCRALEAEAAPVAKQADEGTSAGKLAVRELQAACRQRAPDALAASEAIGVLASKAGQLSANDAAAALQALTKIGSVKAAVAEAASYRRLLSPGVCDDLDTCGVANALWALARRERTDKVPLIGALHARLGELAEQCNPQDVANSLWALAKLRWTPSTDLWHALAARTAAISGDLKPQELSSVLWAIASLGLRTPPWLGVSLQDAVEGCLERFNAQSIANSLWALGRLSISAGGDLQPLQLLTARPTLVTALTERASQLAGTFSPQGLANALWGCAQLGVEASAVTGLARSASQSAAVVAELRGADIGEIAWALGRLGLADAMSSLLCRRAVALMAAGQLDWQAVGRIHYALWQLGLARNSNIDLVRLRKELAARAAVAVDAVNEARGETHGDATRLLLLTGGHGPAQALPARSRALLVDDFGRALGTALRTRGVLVSRWRRFSVGGKGGAPWPSPRKGGDKRYDGAVVRLSATKASLEFALRAVAPLLSKGAPLWVYGARVEGAHVVSGTLRALQFADVRVVGDDGICMVTRGLRSKEEPPVVTFADNASQTELAVGGERVPWCVFPGLFACGGLDIMTSALLDALPTPPERARVLDFCCGSGAIAAALRLRAPPGLRLHLLDADAVALEAARMNLPDARRFFLSDMWAALPEGARYDWIVSNPPVHCGLRSDFTVVSALLSEGPGRLRPGGSLWLVAQTYIPIGCICAAARVSWTDGRFTVWRVRGPPRASSEV